MLCIPSNTLFLSYNNDKGNGTNSRAFLAILGNRDNRIVGLLIRAVLIERYDRHVYGPPGCPTFWGCNPQRAWQHWLRPLKRSCKSSVAISYDHVNASYSLSMNLTLSRFWRSFSLSCSVGAIPSFFSTRSVTSKPAIAQVKRPSPKNRRVRGESEL